MKDRDSSLHRKDCAKKQSEPEKKSEQIELTGHSGPLSEMIQGERKWEEFPLRKREGEQCEKELYSEQEKRMQQDKVETL